MELVVPALEYLDSYRAVLQTGWSHNTLRPQAARETLEIIDKDPAGFIAWQDNATGAGPAVPLPDGTTAPRLPSRSRWMWHDNTFVGMIGVRWQLGTEKLPPYCLGHIGYAVVPHARGRGYATAALAAMLPLASGEGLRWVDITTDPDNVASQRVITANGGQFVEDFVKPDSLGGGHALLFRIHL